MKTCFIIIAFFTNIEGDSVITSDPFWNGNYKDCLIEGVYKKDDEFNLDPFIVSHEVRCVVTDLDQCSKPEG
jgi:hypothetical protein